MSLYKSFSKTKEDDYFLYKLKDNEWEKVKDFLIDNAFSCYLDNGKLKAVEKIADQAEKKNFFEKYIFPSKGNIKSGDFGEILSYYFMIERHKKNKIYLKGPKKWIWKDDNNKAAPGADVLLYSIENSQKPSPKDIVITIESKMSATKAQKSRIQDAIDGAEDDRISRLAKTLIWLDRKYAIEGNITEMNEIKRFQDPVKLRYRKKHYALAIINEVYLQDQLSKDYEKNKNIIIYVISIEKLKEMYEEFFLGALDGC